MTHAQEMCKSFWYKILEHVSPLLDQTKINCEPCCESVMTHHARFHRLHIFVHIFWIYRQRDDLLWTFGCDANDSTANQLANVEQLTKAGHSLHTPSHIMNNWCIGTAKLHKISNNSPTC